ncbi:hypothetical protein LJC07_03645 [Christensenellaceae bacterium OttesenSCG-928-L17]|nr:hypothetical protein [Christensenellaceae bacterium OttesenSCG-928-L17]
MGGCIHDPSSNRDMMEEHRKKGFDDWMDRAPVKESYKDTPQAGWFELGICAAVILVAAVLLIIFL